MFCGIQSLTPSPLSSLFSHEWTGKNVLFLFLSVCGKHISNSPGMIKKYLLNLMAANDAKAQYKNVHDLINVLVC